MCVIVWPAGRMEGNPQLMKCSLLSQLQHSRCRGVTKTWISLFTHPGMPWEDQRAVKRAPSQIDDPTLRKHIKHQLSYKMGHNLPT